MNLAVTIEYRFDRTSDGSVWAQTQFTYSFWLRYLSVFDHVRIIARVRDVSTIPADWQRVDGPGVSFTAIPYYVGPWQYLLQANQVRQAIRRVIEPEDAVIMRVGSHIADCLAPILRRSGHPYGVEVVYDPYDMFAPGSIEHPLRPFFRWWFPRQLRKHCIDACATAYVTEQALQRRYPSAPNGFSTYYSSIELPKSTILQSPRPLRTNIRTLTLITIGSMDHFYKASDVLIDSVARCVAEGLDLRLVLIGDGKHRVDLESKAIARGLRGRIMFCGQLTAGKAVRDQLDQADLFVLPSRQEGLPRAMIEAMARALPCIGSTVGGIPELLPQEDMVPPGDAQALATKISEVVRNPQRMARMSARNIVKANLYSDDRLRERRISFYAHIRERTDAWRTSHHHYSGTLEHM